jgi:hypothetical protein
VWCGVGRETKMKRNEIDNAFKTKWHEIRLKRRWLYQKQKTVKKDLCKVYISSKIALK